MDKDFFRLKNEERILFSGQITRPRYPVNFDWYIEVLDKKRIQFIPAIEASTSRNNKQFYFSFLQLRRNTRYIVNDQSSALVILATESLKLGSIRYSGIVREKHENFRRVSGMYEEFVERVLERFVSSRHVVGGYRDFVKGPRGEYRGIVVLGHGGLDGSLFGERDQA